jgi:hypothetical protein
MDILSCGPIHGFAQLDGRCVERTERAQHGSSGSAWPAPAWVRSRWMPAGRSTLGWSVAPSGSPRIAACRASSEVEHDQQQLPIFLGSEAASAKIHRASILGKPWRLDEQEWEFIHSHPAIGGRIVSAAPALAQTAALTHSTHERIDGHGYAEGLTGPNTPHGSRIIAVCDAFDALTSDQPYRQTIGVDAAIEQLNQHAGTQFDATIVKAFCQPIAPRLRRARLPTKPGMSRSTRTARSGGSSRTHRRSRSRPSLFRAG